MVKIGDTIVYRDEICTVTDIVKKYKNDEDYYVLSSTHDASLSIKVPVSRASEAMRPLMTKREIEILVHKIPKIKVVPINNWNRGVEYKELLRDGSHESIIRVIKTAYLRQQDKVAHKQKPSDSDKQYFRQAERLFYSEIAATLGISYEDAKNYIIEEVDALTSHKQ